MKFKGSHYTTSDHILNMGTIELQIIWNIPVPVKIIATAQRHKRTFYREIPLDSALPRHCNISLVYSKHFLDAAVNSLV